MISKLFERCGAICLEPAKRVRQIEPQAFVEPARDLDVDPPALFGRHLRRIENLEVTTSRDDIRLGKAGGDFRNALRLVLAVAIERDQTIVVAVDGRLEGCAQARAVAPILRVTDRQDGRKFPEKLGCAIGRAVINDQNIARVLDDLAQDADEARFFVVNRNGGQKTHGHNYYYV